MSKTWKIVCCIVGVLTVLGLYCLNTLIYIQRCDNEVDASWSMVEVQLENRSEQISQLAQVTKGYAKHEASVINSIADARKSYNGATTTSDKVSAANDSQKALMNLVSFAENYPDLKANENYKTLMTEISKTQKRIVLAKNRYVLDVNNFNNHVMVPPTSLFATLFGYSKKTQYKVDDPATKTMPDLSSLSE